MTVTFAIKCEHGRTVLAGDSFCGDDSVSDLCAEPKVYTIGPLGVCLAGGIREEQIMSREIRERVNKRLSKAKEITEHWLKVKLVEHIRTALDSHGTLEIKSGVSYFPEASFVLCLHGKSYYFSRDFSLWESTSSYSVIGAGREVASGALYAMHEYIEGLPSVDEAKQMAKIALDACSRWSPWVCPPYTIITLSSE